MPTDAEPPSKLLVTDFDGTITRRDFFWLVVDAFPPAHLEDYWAGYREARLTHFESLAGIFAGIKASDEQMEELLTRAEPDPEMALWVERLRKRGWSVEVASAGCGWYIERVLARAGVHLRVHANPGRFVAYEGLHMHLPTESPFLCPRLGIDKAAIVRAAQKRGSVVAFAGDGTPDLTAARLVPATLRFARADLSMALEGEGLAFQRFDRWADVARALCEEQ